MITILLFISLGAALLLPPPNGTYGVSLRDVQYVDHSRMDPYTNATQRVIPASIISPIGPLEQCQPIQQSYMPEYTARYFEEDLATTYNLTLYDNLTQLELSLCQSTCTKENYPLVLFSPGLGFSRYLYHLIATNIASYGFTVVTVEAPGQVGIVEYLNGTVEYATPNFTTVETLTDGVAVRTQDMIFVLDSLASESCHLNTTAPSIMGHSYGGATSLSAIIADDRFSGGVNLDGWTFGTPLNHAIDKPCIMFASNASTFSQETGGLVDHNQTFYHGWAATWQNMHGPKWQLQMINSTHPTFTDLPLLANAFEQYSSPKTTQVLGTIDPVEAFNIQVSVLSSMAKYLSGQADVGVIKDTVEMFKDVVIVNATDTDPAQKRTNL